MSEALVEAQTVSLRWPGAVGLCLTDVSLSLHRGEILGLLGPNGAGKSSLLRVMAALATPHTGRVLLHDRDIAKVPRREIARQLAFVPQHETAVFGFTVAQMVSLGRAPHAGFFGALDPTDLDVVNEALTRCEVRHLAHRLVGELSGGEAKRVLIARALAQKSSIVLLDEPVAWLDVRHQLDVCNLLSDAVHAGEFSALVVLHDLNLASQFCDRVALMRDGRIVTVDVTANVLTDARVEEVFDTQPFSGELPSGRRFFVPVRLSRTSGAEGLGDTNERVKEGVESVV